VRLEDLPETIIWRRAGPTGPARFEIRYDDGADLMWMLAEFLNAAGVNRAEFLAGTEPEDAWFPALRPGRTVRRAARPPAGPSAPAEHPIEQIELAPIGARFLAYLSANGLSHHIEVRLRVVSGTRKPINSVTL
jgi:hypothetical protein